MNMYTHKISKGDANEDTNSTYQIVVKAISNCHPKIYVGPSYNDPTHQSPVYS